MKKLILKGELSKVKSYIENYISTNGYKDYQVRFYQDLIKIEDSRNIVNDMSYVVRDKLLLVFLGKLTHESQNALLKNIEESQENVAFIFYQERHDDILPTIVSRCHLIDVGYETNYDPELLEIILNSDTQKIDQWVFYERISEFVDKNGISLLSPTLRYILLDKIQDRDLTCKFYKMLKAYFKYSKLNETNNVGKAIVIEKIFNVLY